MSAPAPPAAVTPIARGAAVATPLAHRVAKAHGVSLTALAGTGPRGRITRRDVLDAAGIARSAAGHERRRPRACARDPRCGRLLPRHPHRHPADATPGGHRATHGRGEVVGARVPGADRGRDGRGRLPPRAGARPGRRGRRRALAERLRRQGGGAGAARPPARQQQLRRRRLRAPRAGERGRRRRRGGRARRPDGLRRRREVRWARSRGPCGASRTTPARAGCVRRICREARSRCRISGCSA